MNLLPKALFLCAAVLLSSPSAEALEFLYKFNAGDKYRILSTVHHDILVNRQLSYRSEIVNRIAVEVKDVVDGKGSLAATFQSAERTVTVLAGGFMGEAAGFQWEKDYHSEFLQDELGYVTVDARYFKPMVRDVPVFPGRELSIGDRWTSPGIVVHDFRDGLGIEEPFTIPFTALYTYVGERTWKGKNYPAFLVSIQYMIRPPAIRDRVYLRRIEGSTDQTIYWDIEAGQVAAYEERFKTILELSDGEIWEYRGMAEAEVVESLPMNREAMLADIAADLATIPDASARYTDEGIVISLENIQFSPDSAVLLPGEGRKLDAISGILKKYPDRDILVGGHTALAGTAESRATLSLQRAQVVADHLLSEGVRTPERMVIRGYGAEQPLADNRTEAGMRQNRRVEIIILEN